MVVAHVDILEIRNIESTEEGGGKQNTFVGE